MPPQIAASAASAGRASSRLPPAYGSSTTLRNGELKSCGAAPPATIAAIAAAHTSALTSGHTLRTATVADTTVSPAKLSQRGPRS